MLKKQVKTAREIIEWYVKGLQFDPVDLLAVTVIPGENIENIHYLRETTILVYEDIQRQALPYFLSLMQKLDAMPEQATQQQNIKSAKVTERRPKKPVEHMHRCPICDRMRRVVRENLRKIRIQLNLAEKGTWPPTWRVPEVFAAFLDNFYGIEQAISARHIRKLQNLSDEESEEYIATNLVNEDWKPVTPRALQGKVDGEELTRPALTLIWGGIHQKN